jgi:DNA-binding winged helix-turn-helix (wHTH) protein
MFIGRLAEQNWLKGALAAQPIAFIHGLKGVGKKSLVQQTFGSAVRAIFLRSPFKPEMFTTLQSSAEKPLVFADFHRLPSHERLQFVDELQSSGHVAVVLSDLSVDLEIDFAIPRLHLKPFTKEEFAELVAIHKPGATNVESTYDLCMGVPLLVQLWLLGSLDPRAVESSFLGRLSPPEQQLLKAISSIEEGLEEHEAVELAKVLELDESVILSLRHQYLLTDEGGRTRVNAPFLPSIARLKVRLPQALVDRASRGTSSDVDRLSLALEGGGEDIEEKLLKVQKGQLQRLDPSYLKVFISLLSRQPHFHAASLQMAASVLVGERGVAIERALATWEQVEAQSASKAASQLDPYQSRFLIDIVNLLNRASREETALKLAQAHLHDVVPSLKNELVLEFIVAHKDLASQSTFDRLQSLLRGLDERASALACHVRFQMSRSRGLNHKYEESAALLTENYQVYTKESQFYDAGFAGFNAALMFAAAGLDAQAEEWIAKVEHKIRIQRFPYLHFGITLLKSSLARRRGALTEASTLLMRLRPAFESASLPLRAKRDYAKECSLVLHLQGKHQEAYALASAFDFSSVEKLESLNFKQLSEITDLDLSAESSLELKAHAIHFGLAKGTEPARYLEFLSKLDGGTDQIRGAHPLWELVQTKAAKTGTWIKTNERFFSDESWEKHLTGADLALVDFESRVLIKGKEARDFKTKRTLFKALRLLIEAFPKEVSKEALVRGLWGEEYDPLSHDSRIYASIQRLRESVRKTWIETGESGYRLAKSVTFVFVVSHAPEDDDYHWLEQRILRIFRDLKGSRAMKRSELTALLQTSDASLKRALLQLTQSGHIEKVGSGPQTQYRLIG